MPIYSYKCSVCEKKQEIIRSMFSEDIPICCNVKMNRDYQSDMSNVGNREYAKPIHSDSLAIMPSQRKEHERLFPDIELDNENRPVFINYKQHDKYLEKTGFVKLPQRKRRKATRVV